MRLTLVMALAVIIASGSLFAAFCSTSHCVSKMGPRIARPDCCSSSCQMMRGGDAKANTLRATEARSQTPSAVALQTTPVVVAVISAPPAPRRLARDSAPAPQPLDASLYLRNAQFLI